jgi:ParB/RepB/Spo0J family partition protein
MALSSEYVELPVDAIYYDKAFNCRGEFTPQSCLDLAQSIQQHGLQFPVVVQPASDAGDSIPEGFDYRLIVGHRRFTAITQLLNRDTIAAHVRWGLNEQQIRILNLIENLERKSISLLDEGNAIHSIFSEEISYKMMARETSKSTHWCRIRWLIPTLPEEIQQDCAAGRLSAADINIILSADSMYQLAMAQEIKMARGRGESEIKRHRKYSAAKRAKKRLQIREMLADLMSRRIKPSPYRALAWAAGDLTDEAFLGEYSS